METYLRCQIGPGMFSGEVSVRGVAADGEEFSLFASDALIERDASDAWCEQMEGWLRVEELAREGDRVLIRLPEQTFENGRTITVRDSQLNSSLRRQPV